MNCNDSQNNPLDVKTFSPNWKYLLQKLDTIYYHCKLTLFDNIAVSLSDVLRVRRGQLTEAEIWSLLSASADALDNFLVCSTQNLDFMIDISSLESLLISAAGKVTFKEINSAGYLRRGSTVSNSESQHVSDQLSTRLFLSGNKNSTTCQPEVKCGRRCSVTWAIDRPRKQSIGRQESCVDGELLPNDPIEMKYVYKLGKQLRIATECHGNHEEMENVKAQKLGTLLNAVLTAMCEERVEFRMRLLDIIRICSVHVAKYTNREPASRYVQRLHDEVLKTLPESEILNEVDNKIKLEQEYHQFVCEIEKLTTRGKDQCMCMQFIGDSDYDYLGGTTYGKRIGFQPNKEESMKPKLECKVCKPSLYPKVKPNDRWRWAYLKIISDRKLQKMSENSCFEFHPAKNAIATVSKELIERRIVILRLHGKHVYSSGAKSSVRGQSSKFKTGSEKVFQSLPSLVTLLQQRSALLSSEQSCESNEDRFRRNFQSEIYISAEDEMKDIPEISITLHSKTLKNVQVIRVIVPYYCVFRVKCNISTTLCKTILRNITNIYLGLKDLSNNFKLGYYYKDEFYFLSNLARVSIVPEDRKGNAEISEVFATLYLKIKYFVKNVKHLRDEVTRRIYYLILKYDLINSHIKCAKDERLNLIDLLKTKRQTEEDEMCNMFFLRKLFESEFYGKHSYKFLQDKRNQNYVIWLSIGISGLSVLEESKSGFVITQDYKWKDIKRISYKNYKLKLVPESRNKYGSSVAYSFYSTDAYKCKQVFKLCAEYNKYYLNSAYSELY